MTGQRMVDDIFDWTHDKLSGRVHTVNTDVRCFISEDRERLESPELVSSESTEYEAGGKRRIRVLVFKDSKSVYQYDTAGHQIESVTTGPDGQFRDREISTFDVDGRLVSTLLEFHDGEKVIQHFAYSSMGFSVELTATGRRVVETYDIAGNRMLSEVYSSEGKLVQKQIFDYDSQRRLTEIVTSTTWMHERVIERTQTGGPTTTSRRPLASKVDKAIFSYDRDGSPRQGLDTPDDAGSA